MKFEDELIRIYMIIISSFFAGFSICINNEYKKKKPDFKLALSEVLVHGISGCATGMLIGSKFDNIFLICATSIMGGIMGKNVINILFKVIISIFTNAKNIEVEEKEVIK